MDTEFWWNTSRDETPWEDNVKMDLREIGCEDVNWIHLIQDWVQ
jgi:hypothetical protein